MCGRPIRKQSWQNLQALGEMGEEDNRLELRNCGCGTTLAIKVELPEPEKT